MEKSNDWIFFWFTKWVKWKDTYVQVWRNSWFRHFDEQLDQFGSLKHQHPSKWPNRNLDRKPISAPRNRMERHKRWWFRMFGIVGTSTFFYFTFLSICKERNLVEFTVVKLVKKHENQKICGKNCRKIISKFPKANLLTRSLLFERHLWYDNCNTWHSYLYTFFLLQFVTESSWSGGQNACKMY